MIDVFKKIFLGDAGSTFLGFFFGWLLIYYSQEPLKLFHPVLCVWCVTVPVYDLLSVILKRISENKNPFKPDSWNNIDDNEGWIMSYGFGPRFILLGLPVQLDYSWQYNPFKGKISDRQWQMRIGLDF